MGSPFRVSICGGGIGGLTLALVISKYSKLPVDIYEAGPTISTIGAGISLFGKTMDMMKDLGLYDAFVKMANAPPQGTMTVTFRKSDQQDGYHWFSKSFQRNSVGLHRKDLVEFLWQQVQASCNVYTSKKLKCYGVHPDTGEVTLYFSDGSFATTDVLVGADGIHSATRRTMYQKLASSTQNDGLRKRLLDCIDPIWTGILMYRSLIPAAGYLKECPDVKITGSSTLYLGRRKHVVAYPISQGRQYNVVVYRHDTAAFGSPFEGQWATEVSEKEVQDQFENWEVHVRALLKCVERPSRWALHTVRPLPQYVDGRVALLGDAAHAMEPHFGAGAGQAMEDAFVLGRLLTHELTHRGNVADALKIYEEVRLPVANYLVQHSRNLGRCYGFQYVPPGGVPAHGSPEELDHMRKLIEDIWEWQDKSARDEAEKRWRQRCSVHLKL